MVCHQQCGHKRSAHIILAIGRWHIHMAVQHGCLFGRLARAQLHFVRNFSHRTRRYQYVSAARRRVQSVCRRLHRRDRIAGVRSRIPRFSFVAVFCLGEFNFCCAFSNSFETTGIPQPRYMRNCMQTLAIAYICDMRYALMHTPVCGSPRTVQRFDWRGIP